MSKVIVDRENLMRMATQVVEMLLVKNKEYGNAWEDLDIFTPLMRIREKLIRVETLNDKRKAITAQEGVDKELPDIAGYCLLGMLKFEANIKEQLDNKFKDIVENGEPVGQCWTPTIYPITDSDNRGGPGVSGPSGVSIQDFEKLSPEDKLKIIADCVVHENDDDEETIGPLG
jgi:hypothetical protein